MNWSKIIDMKDYDLIVEIYLNEQSHFLPHYNYLSQSDYMMNWYIISCIGVIYTNHIYETSWFNRGNMFEWIIISFAPLQLFELEWIHYEVMYPFVYRWDLTTFMKRHNLLGQTITSFVAFHKFLFCRSLQIVTTIWIKQC